MPELPEVETTRRGISSHIVSHTITSIRINNKNLRWPVPVGILQSVLPGQKIISVARRAKYLLIDCGNGHLILHLGMSGSLRIVNQAIPLEKHEHVEILLSNGTVMRLRDPRRFGAVLWTDEPPEQHSLLVALGPEPLSDTFHGEYLYQKSRKRSCPIKNFIMNAHIVVGVGNIYASESLFHARIHPSKAAGKLSRQSCVKLVQTIKEVLKQAIAAGGTTLRDFTDSSGRAGYFSQRLFVYARDGENCLQCGGLIKREQIGQRSSFYCPYCQK